MKKLMLICAPVSSRSGYGDHARDLVTSFINHDKYDIKIMDVRWGDCPRNALDKNNEVDKKILDCILPNPKMDQQPDIYVDIRIPNEFQTYGKFNIGITAGIETDIVSNSWIEGCNKMDFVIVPSEHSKEGFINSIYDKYNNLPDGKQEKVGELKFEKPMEVLFEGADDNIYKPLNTDEMDKEFFDWLNDEVPEKFAYLFVGLWGKGGYGEDRKDISTLIKIFYQTFANKKRQPALILKTSGAGFSILDKEECLNRIEVIKNKFPSEFRLPNVYLLHGDLTDEEMNELYNHPKTKCMVSLTHGEGFGRPLLEASMVGTPIITTSWSGQMDFLNPDDSLLLPGNLKQVPKSAVWKDIVVEQSNWFVVHEDTVPKAMNYVFSNPLEAKKRAKDLMEKNRKKFTLKGMEEKLDEIMEKHMKNVPSQVSLNLPKLSKINTDKQNEPQKIKLPKLTKV